MKITVHEAAQRTRNEVSLDDVIDVIDDIAYENGFNIDITTSDEIHFINRDGVLGEAELFIPTADIGFKEASGGRLVADKSTESVLAKLSRLLVDYVSVDSKDSTLDSKYFDAVKTMAKAYDDKAKEMRKG